MARAGYTVCYVIAEGTRHSLMCRLIAIYSGVDLSGIRTGKLKDVEYSKIAHAAGIISQLKLYMIEETRWVKIRAHVQALKLQTAELAGVFFDYIGLIEVSRNYREREREVAFLSADIKRLAKDLNIICFPLVQLNREVEKRKDHRPILSDLRESGAIEQDADCVLFPYRPAYYGEKCDFPTDAEVAISKNREGATGVAEVKFESSCVRFSERDA
jgi:replicative DNA helicase